MSDVVRRFLIDKPRGTQLIQASIDDAEHYTPEQRKAIVDAYPEHEREARAKGIPVMGSGKVFPVAESVFKVEPFPLPAHWPRIVGIDFGFNHPTAAAWLAWDRDSDTIYLYDSYRQKGESVAIHSSAIRSKGDWIPVAWPHDGLQHDKGSGLQLAKQYKDQGLSMLAERATFEDGTNGLEAGISEMLTRMQTGRLKVFSHITDFFEENATYHRKNGLIVKLNDDLISATRYGIMMRRKARTQSDSEYGSRFKSLPTISFDVLDPVAGY
jgi:hypothetical protein